MDETTLPTEVRAELLMLREKVTRLQADLTEARDLTDRMTDNVRDANDMVDRWIAVFRLEQDDKGVFIFDPKQTELWNSHADLLDAHQKLIRKWNRAVSDFNATVAPKDLGRPMAASDAQRAEVLKRRKAGESYRKIAASMSLGLRTVRTIIEKSAGKDRASKRERAFRRLEFNRMRVASFRARKRDREALPKELADHQKRAEGLLKEAKGLGRN